VPVQPAAGARPELAANLSLADLDRVRKALALMSDEPTGTPGQTAARDDGPVPSSVSANLAEAPTADGDNDDADTAPLPVILPGAATVPRPGELEAPRGPFEPPRTAPALTDAAPVEAFSGPQTGAAPEVAPVPAEAEQADPAGTLPPAAAKKLDQIKDLLITAEAIGETNLDRHFERVSQRQRELIREFFDRAMPGREPDA